MGNGREAFWDWSDQYNGQDGLRKRTHMELASLKMLHYKKDQSMVLEKNSEIPTRDFAMLDKDT